MTVSVPCCRSRRLIQPCLPSPRTGPARYDGNRINAALASRSRVYDLTRDCRLANRRITPSDAARGIANSLGMRIEEVLVASILIATPLPVLKPTIDDVGSARPVTIGLGSEPKALGIAPRHLRRRTVRQLNRNWRCWASCVARTHKHVTITLRKLSSCRADRAQPRVFNPVAGVNR